MKAKYISVLILMNAPLVSTNFAQQSASNSVNFRTNEMAFQTVGKALKQLLGK